VIITIPEETQDRCELEILLFKFGDRCHSDFNMFRKLSRNEMDIWTRTWLVRTGDGCVVYRVVENKPLHLMAAASRRKANIGSGTTHL
jgi:hypothetical protein